MKKQDILGLLAILPVLGILILLRVMRDALRETEIYSAVLVIGVILIGVISVFVLLTQVRKRLSTPPRRVRDVSAEQRPASPVVRLHATPLQKLGFTRLGEYAPDLLGKAEQTNYLFLDTSRSVIAEIVQATGKPVLVRLFSYFPDESVFETLYPYGRKRDEPNYRAQFETETLGAAYAQHQAGVTQWAQEHGHPTTFRSMADWLVLDMRYRERYGADPLQGLLWVNALNAAFPFLLVGTFGFMVAAPNLTWLPEDIATVIAGASLTLLVIAGLVSWWANSSTGALLKDMERARRRQEAALKQANHAKTARKS